MIEDESTPQLPAHTNAHPVIKPVLTAYMITTLIMESVLRVFRVSLRARDDEAKLTLRFETCSTLVKLVDQHTGDQEVRDGGGTVVYIAYPLSCPKVIEYTMRMG